jgi:hypothetical protein
MESMSRRMLLTSGMAGLVVATLPDVQGRGTQKDEIGDHILREGKRLARDLQGGLRRHETITAIATNLRLHAAHVRATGVELTVAQAVNRRVFRKGRRGLIEEANGPQAMQRHHDQLREFGLEDLHVPERDVTSAQSEQALTMLQTPGQLAGALEQTAVVFDQFAEKTALMGDGGARIVRVQGSIDAWCGTMRTICEMMKTTTAIVCALSAAGFVELAPLCALLSVEVATACFLAWWGGC